MNFFDRIKSFAHDEDGAVTVDWVVLCAALVGLGIAVISVVRPAISTQSTNIADTITSQSISTNF